MKSCERLTHIMKADGIHEIDEKERQEILQRNMQFADQGLRVLGFAYRILPDS